LFEWFFRGDHLELHINWREELIEVKAYILLCEKLCSNLDDEITTREIENSLPHTIIPVNSVSSIHQVVQGIVHYVIYESRQRRIKNRGLLLAALILGFNQINDLIENLKKHFETSPYYYLIGVNSKPGNLHKCSTLRQEDFLKKPSTMNTLVKNVLIVTSLI